MWVEREIRGAAISFEGEGVWEASAGIEEMDRKHAVHCRRRAV